MRVASWLSMNYRSNNSIHTSRLPGLSVYCCGSTTGQQVRVLMPAW